MAEENNHPPQEESAVIAGFGVPGRAVAEWMTAHNIKFVVIEQNDDIVQRCSQSGTSIIPGDVRDPEALLRAGIERASIFAVAVPSEAIVLEAVSVARRLNPRIRIIARCSFISGGLEAMRRGADETIVAEEIAAREFVRLLEGGHAAIRPSHQTHLEVNEE